MAFVCTWTLRFLSKEPVTSMKKSHLVKVFDPLPYSVRRACFRTLFKRRFNRLQGCRDPKVKEGFQLSGLDDTRSIFVHVPKCGGRSIAKALYKDEHVGHATHRQYRILFSKEEYRSYYKFAIVRNPWDRLVSAFHYLKGGGNGPDDQLWADENLKPFEDFDTFVREWLPGKKLNSIYWHFMTQTHFTHTESGTNELDFIGHFETLEDDYNTIAKRLGIETRLPALNASKRRTDFRSYYTDNTAEIAAKSYQVDIDAFGYRFDDLARD